MSHGLWLGSWARFVVGNRLAPYVPTPHDVAPHLLKLAALRPGEVLVDLGCGDGRLLHAAVHRFGAARATGFELDPALAQQARELGGEDGRIEVFRADALSSTAADALSGADVVALYLSDRGNASLLPVLRERLRPSARVVSYVWEMPEGTSPSKTVLMNGSGAPMHLYEGLGTAGAETAQRPRCHHSRTGTDP